MVNFSNLSPFHRRPKTVDVHMLADIRSPAEEQENYHIYYDPLPEVASSLWMMIKNRRKHATQTNRIRTTRYNILTFLPKNLFEQFHRVANIYFAISVALNFVPGINGISKTVSFIPLTIILSIKAIKDLAEDLKRWRSDVHINQQIAEVYDKKSQTFVECKWEDLSVGSIIRVRADQTVPADILLLSSTSSEKTCYLDTAAIDGETNLKQRSIPICFLTVTKPEETSFELQCDRPNDDIYRFRGRILSSTGTDACSCDNNNVLLRGCVLRITDYIEGLIVYAGNQTKIIQSSKLVSSKRALIERSINRDVLFASFVLLSLCLLGAGLSISWAQSYGDQWIHVPFVIGNPYNNVASDFFTSAIRYMIIFQVMIPVALYISLDIVRVLQMSIIARDKNLKYEHSISCRNFTINEDLGQIGYVFSDKTGTITQNKLVFKAASIAGVLYSDRSELPNENDPLVDHFLTAMAVCNTTFIVHEQRELMDRLDYQPKYEGDNVDDLVLCQAASNFGVRMMSRSARTMTVRYLNRMDTDKEDCEYEIVCILPFDSSRRRMSVIVRANDRIYLYIKGAETSIWPNLSASNHSDIKRITEQHSLGFSEQGYRILLVAYRQIPLEEFQHWFEQYRKAANSLTQREEAISAAAANIEVDLILGGLTAVEDKLQEGVPKTIATLRCAGIKIWLLTGDKQATALSTAQAASLVNIRQALNSDDALQVQSTAPAMTAWDFDSAAQAQLKQHTHMIYYSEQLLETNQQFGNAISNEMHTEETIDRMGKVIVAQTLPVCLVVTGDELGVILQYRAKAFIQAVAQCQSVLFCRVSATQKRELVVIAKTVFKHRILAIGDGTNDVGMIREAHCGVAVYGREGSQAVASGDFIVDRFECLRHLLLVHGAWCYTRTSELILYTFLHNCQFIFVLFYYQFFNGFSGNTPLTSVYQVLYASLFSNFPQCAAALYDQHISRERALREPQLYQYTQSGTPYRMSSYWINFVDAIYQSTVIFFITYYSYQNQSAFDVFSLGFSLIFSMMVTASLHVLIQTTRIHRSVIICIVLSFLFFLGFSLAFDATCLTCLPPEDPYGVSYHTFRQGRFWFTSLFVSITALLPRFTIKCFYNSTHNPLRYSSNNAEEVFSTPVTTTKTLGNRS